MKPYCILPQAGNFHPCWDCSSQDYLPALPLAGWETCELQSPHIWKVLCWGRQTYCILWHRIMLRMSFWFCNMYQLVVPISSWGDIIWTLLFIYLTQLTQPRAQPICWAILTCILAIECDTSVGVSLKWGGELSQNSNWNVIVKVKIQAVKIYKDVDQLTSVIQ